MLKLGNFKILQKLFYRAKLVCKKNRAKLLVCKKSNFLSKLYMLWNFDVFQVITWTEMVHENLKFFEEDVRAIKVRNVSNRFVCWIDLQNI